LDAVQRDNSRASQRTFRSIGYESAHDREKVSDTVVADLRRFEPDVIILTGTSDKAVAGVVLPFEAALAAGAHHPYYVVAGSLEGEAFVKLLKEHPRVAGRIVGITAPANTPANLKFTSSYNATFNEQLPPALSPGAPYDSFYLVAYATYAALAAGVAMPRGSDLARAMGKLGPPGKSVEVGPGRILDAFGALQRGESVDLQGTYSRMDFDLATGESPADYAIVCPVLKTDSGETTIDNVESGLVYDAKEHKLRGTFSCPAPK
jgi:hypothetical protein